MRGLAVSGGRVLAALLACVLGMALCACPAPQVAAAQAEGAQAEGAQDGSAVYTVTFASNGGSSVEAQQVAEGGWAHVPEAPVKTGYTLVGWYSDSSCTSPYDFATPVGADLVLFAKWAVATYRVSFEAGGADDVDAQQVAYGESAEEPDDPVRTGYTFLGWYADAACTKPYDFSTAVYSDVTLHAKWAVKVYGVRFVANGGTKVSAQDVEHGKCVGRPQPDPTREGYAFQGWYADADLTQEFDFTAPVTSNLKLYAKWARLCTVAFEPNGGSEVESQVVTDGSAASVPGVPVREGYTFAGWCSDKLLSCAYDFDAPVTGSLTLYAKWEKDVPAAVAFTDLVEPWSFTWVEQASERGLMSGYDDGAGNLTGLFYPSLNITRGQVATVLWRIAGSPEPGSTASFDDVPQGKYFTAAVAWCSEQGVVTGYQGGSDAGRFLPYADVTREELATMVWRFAGYMGVTVAEPPTASFAACIDSANVASWAHDALVWCAAAGVITGKDTDEGLRLDAGWGATRAQAAKVFVQLDKLVSGELYPYDDTDAVDPDPDPGDSDDDADDETPTRPSGSVVEASLTYGVTSDGFSYVVVPEDYADADGYAYVLDQAYDELGGRYVGPGAYILGYTGSSAEATLPERVAWPVKVVENADMEVSGSIAGPSVVSANLSWRADDADGRTRLTSLAVTRGSSLVQLDLAGSLVDGVALSGEGEGGLSALRFLDLSDTQTQALDTSEFPALEQLGLARCPLGADALESLTSWCGATGLPADLTDAGQSGDADAAEGADGALDGEDWRAVDGGDLAAPDGEPADDGSDEVADEPAADDGVATYDDLDAAGSDDDLAVVGDAA